MSTDDETFRPRLGHIGRTSKDAPDKQAQIGRFAALSGRAIRANPSCLPAGTIRNKGRGKGAAAVAAYWARAHARRVVIRVYIARASPDRNAAFTRYLSYIRRDRTQPDGTRGRMYSDTENELGVTAFNERARNDPHQFRIIVSAEDGERFPDLKTFTRSLMSQANADLSTELDWVAIDHFDTDHPHTHIVVRGADSDGAPLYIDRRYLTTGLRHRAEEIASQALGPRSWREVIAARVPEINKDAYTSIDRVQIEPLTRQSLEFAKPGSAMGKYERSLLRRRFQHLQSRGLAHQVTGQPAKEEWRLEEGWTAALKRPSRSPPARAREPTTGQARTPAAHFNDLAALRMQDGEISGRLSRVFPIGDIGDRIEVHIDGLDGKTWRANISEAEASRLPDKGGIVSLSVHGLAEHPADRTIEEIAARHGGVYSDVIHALSAPESAPAYRRVHIDRLRQLVRAGIVAPARENIWQIPDGLTQLARETSARSQSVLIKVHSWLAVERLVTRNERTWLDALHDIQAIEGRQGFAGEVDRALTARRAWLQEEMSSLGQLSAFDAEALHIALTRFSDNRGKQAMMLGPRARFHGTYTGHIDLARFRFAVIESRDRVIAIPWTGKHAHLLGQEIEIRNSAAGLELSRGRSRT